MNRRNPMWIKSNFQEATLFPGMRLYFGPTIVPSLVVALFDGHTLGQIPRLIDIRALENSHVISQQLQGHGVHHR